MNEQSGQEFSKNLLSFDSSIIKDTFENINSLEDAERWQVVKGLIKQATVIENLKERFPILTLEMLPEIFKNETKFFLSYRENLTQLPEGIGKLVNLKKLYLSNNQLETLPESIGNLTQLEELSLDGNPIATLPDSFGNLCKLKWLFFLMPNLRNYLRRFIGYLS